MFKNLVFTSIFIFAFTSVIMLKAQTIKQRSDKVYNELQHASAIRTIELLNELTLYRLSDSIDRADFLALKAVEKSRIIRNPEILTKSLVNLSSILVSRNQPDSALTFLREAEVLLKKHSFTEQQGMFYYVLGRALLSKKQYPESLTALNKGIKNAEHQKDDLLLGRLYLSKANVYKQLNQKQNLLSSITKSDQYLNKADNPLIIGPHLLGLGVHYADLLQSDKANMLFLKAVSLCEMTADSLYLGYLYLNLSNIYYAHNQNVPGEEYFQKSLGVFRRMNNNKGIAYVLNIKAIGLTAEKKYKEAIALYTEAGVRDQKASDWQGACFVYSNLCESYLFLNNRSAAEQAITTAGEMYRKAGDKLSLAAYLESKGKYHQYCKNFDQALECFSASLTIAQNIQVLGIVEENLLAISEMYQAKGDAALALRYYKIYMSGRDSVMHASNVQVLAEVLAKYETGKKNDQGNSSAGAGYSSTRGKYYLVGNIIAVVLLLFVSIVFFFRLKGNYTERLQFMLTLRHQVNQQRERAIEFLAPVLPDKASKPLLTEKMQTGLWQQLEELMQKEKLFLSQDMTLSELAKRLNTNTTYLSKVINEISDQNFSNYLNQYRIDEACRLLSGSQGRNMTIEGIAQTVGFNSKSAFNSAFRKFKSVTPSEYLLTQNEVVELVG